MPVTPVPGNASQITTGGTPVVAILGNTAGVNGGYITNPIDPTDQGLVNAEPLYIDPVGDASTSAHGTTFRLEPGATWTLIPGQTTPTSVNAATSGHKFSVVSW